MVEAFEHMLIDDLCEKERERLDSIAAKQKAVREKESIIIERMIQRGLTQLEVKTFRYIGVKHNGIKDGTHKNFILALEGKRLSVDEKVRKPSLASVGDGTEVSFVPIEGENRFELFEYLTKPIKRKVSRDSDEPWDEL